MKEPNQCENMTDIRNEIDRIDRKVISLIAERAQYVSSASKFKKDKTSVKAPERVKALLEKRAEWAKEKNINPEIIIKIYTELVHFFINEEMNKWKNENI